MAYYNVLVSVVRFIVFCLMPLLSWHVSHKMSTVIRYPYQSSVFPLPWPKQCICTLLFIGQRINFSSPESYFNASHRSLFILTYPMGKVCPSHVTKTVQMHCLALLSTPSITQLTRESSSASALIYLLMSKRKSTPCANSQTGTRSAYWGWSWGYY